MVECENPRIILNPSIAELVSRYQDYYLNNQWHHDVYKYRSLYKFNKKPFNCLLAKGIINKDNYENNFVVDRFTGASYPIYLCVPCGNCILCKEKKVNSFVNRMKYESFLYPYKPLFITCTFDDKHLPDNGCTVRLCQLFLKRLRQNLHRGGFTQPIRYVLVSEYGKRTHRSHIHAIIYGLPIDTDRDLRRFEVLLNKSWQMGFTLSRQIDMRNQHTAYYTTKYLRKGCVLPSDHHVKPFCLSSRGHGGIGSGFYKREAEQLHKRVKTDVDVFNPWTNCTEPLQWSKYCLDKIYPSLCTSIPLELRKALRTWCHSYNLIRQYESDILWLYEDLHEKVKEKFSDLLFLPYDWDDVLPDPSKHCHINSARKVILKYIDNDYSGVKKIDEQRSLLLSNIALQQCDVDLVQKVVKIKRKHKYLENLEKL